MELYGYDKFDFHFANTEDLYDVYTMKFKPVIAKFDLCEIVLDFVLDAPGKKPSVSLRMLPLDAGRWVAEVEGLRRKQDVPGQWVE